MESSPVVRGGVVLNKNKNITYYKKNEFSRAVCSALICSTLIGVSADAQSEVIPSSGSRTYNDAYTHVWGDGTTTITGDLSIYNAQLTNRTNVGTTTGTLFITGQFIGSQQAATNFHFYNSARLVTLGNATFSNVTENNFLLENNFELIAGQRLFFDNSIVKQKGGLIQGNEVVLKGGSYTVTGADNNQLKAVNGLQIENTAIRTSAADAVIASNRLHLPPVVFS